MKWPVHVLANVNCDSEHSLIKEAHNVSFGTETQRNNCVAKRFVIVLGLNLCTAVDILLSKLVLHKVKHVMN